MQFSLLKLALFRRDHPFQITGILQCKKEHLTGRTGTGSRLDLVNLGRRSVVVQRVVGHQQQILHQTIQSPILFRLYFCSNLLEINGSFYGQIVVWIGRFRRQQGEIIADLDASVVSILYNGSEQLLQQIHRIRRRRLQMVKQLQNYAPSF